MSSLEWHSRWLRAILAALIGLVVAAILLDSLVSLTADRVKGWPARPLLHALVRWGPAVFYLWALWSIRRALGDVAAGRSFQPAFARRLRDVGLGLAAGALMSAVVQPNLMRLLSAPGLRFPFAAWGHFDVAYIAVGAIGLALILLSRLLARAAEMQAELEQFV